MNRNSVLRLYGKYKKLSGMYMGKGRLNEAFGCLYYACYLMYAYQIRICDDEIEALLGSLGEKALGCGKIRRESGNKGVMFYDSLARDRIALSRQYLEALIQIGEPFTYVICAEKSDAQELISLVRGSVAGTLEVIPGFLSYVEQMRTLRTLFEKYVPERVLLHMANGDVTGAAFWQMTAGTERFYINHGDEQFWVGKNALDYLLCYRGSGARIAIDDRGIAESRVLMQPYYPAVFDECFQGLDFDLPKDGVLLFSGGRYVKVYNENNEFAKMTVDILQRNPNAYFLFAGSGDSRGFEEQLRQGGVLDRCKMIPYRKDLMGLMRRIDVYLSTYPVNGGLMAQFAALARKPVVERASEESGRIEELFPKLSGETKICYETPEQYHATVDRLIGDEEMRAKLGETLHDGLITENEFDRNLERILKDQKSAFPVSGETLNIGRISERLIQIDNRYMHRFWALQLNKYILRSAPLRFVYAGLMFVRPLKLFRINAIWSTPLS